MNTLVFPAGRGARKASQGPPGAVTMSKAEAVRASRRLSSTRSIRSLKKHQSGLSDRENPTATGNRNGDAF